VDRLSSSAGTDPMGWRGVASAEGTAGLVVGPDVLHQLAAQLARGGEDAPGNAVPLDLGKPKLHLVEPGAIGRGVVNGDPGVRRQPVPDRLRLVSGEIVADQVDRPAPRLGADDVVEKLDELGAGVPGGGPALDVPGADLQRGVEREGAVPHMGGERGIGGAVGQRPVASPRNRRAQSYGRCEGGFVLMPVVLATTAPLLSACMMPQTGRGCV
jgi:hypothetical protein